jgi:RNA polymerase sigma factor (sigma-70 family)
VTGDTLGDIIRRIGRSVSLQSDLALTDAQLLERFVARRDEPAFAALVVRHGPMVLGVCRRLVRDAQEAEDAFQATFLVLARKAAVIQRQPLLAGWLYGVAYRVAVRLRGRTVFRRTREERDVDLTTLAAADDGGYSDMRPLVHEEVGRLPDKYRSAVVLCYLEGKTNEEAALQLRWPVGTVKSRLARARELLRTRLTRRGVTLSAGLLTTALVANKASASPALVDATIRGAALFAAGDAVAGRLISARAVKLSYGVLRTMILTKAKIVTMLVLTVAMLGGAGGVAYRSLAAGADDTPNAAPMKSASHDADRPKADTDAEKIQGIWRVVGVETEGVKRDDQDARDQKTWTWTFRGDKLVIHIESPGPARNVKTTFKLDPTRKPKTIDVTADTLAEDSKEKTALRGIYSVEGDALKICYGLSDAEIQQSREGFKEPSAGKSLSHAAGLRPKEMATKEGSKSTLLTLKREAADKDKLKDDKEAIQGLWQPSSTEVSKGGAAIAFVDSNFPPLWRITADAVVVKSQTDEFRLRRWSTITWRIGAAWIDWPHDSCNHTCCASGEV